MLKKMEKTGTRQKMKENLQIFPSTKKREDTLKAATKKTNSEGLEV
jgi:hypothetical protein